MKTKPFTCKGGIFYFRLREDAERVRNNLWKEGFYEACIEQRLDGFCIRRFTNGPRWGYPKMFGIPGWE